MVSDLPQSRRPPVRMDAEDGPWSISVAEAPHDVHSYILYIKTPTHNLTLTRMAREIVELNAKLRDAHPDVTLPSLPLDADSVMSQPPKRKSTFLNTLSRLASPHSNKIRKANNGGGAATPSKVAATPLASPTWEQDDPFLTVTPSTNAASAAVNSTSLASYLTTISNNPPLRQARVWKRFVRVRTDDLESVRVERAIKRVRSDLAAHTGMKGKDRPPSQDAGKEAVHDSLPEESKKQEEAEDVDSAQARQTSDAEGTPLETLTQVVESHSTSTEEESPKTPVSAGLASRLHRSRSAGPDNSARLSRAFTSSSTEPDGASSSQTDMETGDESSTSHVKKPKKKQSLSGDPRKKGKKVAIDHFEMMRVLGKGCAGKVLLVKHKSSSDLYALKAITKRHVLAHQELQHTLTEQAVLKRMSAEAKDPFVVKLWYSFHDKENLFLVMDFHPGGDLATQLARWGRLGRDRARFYAAEIVEGVEGLHAAGVIYRDLKPENILIGGDGHIVLTDFGLSKEFPMRGTPTTPLATPSDSRADFTGTSSLPPVTPPWLKIGKGGELALGWPGVGREDTTATFCGTAEYLAPEVIQGLMYSYEVDWWSFGTMLYEMLTGITPFWAQSHSEMYVRVLQDELQFPDDRAIDQDTKSLLRGLLQKNPALRICEPRVKRHPYFSMIDWSHVYYKRYIPPYIPPTDPSNRGDTQNFDDTFLDMEPVLDEYVEEEAEQTDTDQDNGDATDTDRTDGDATTPSQSRSSSVAANARARPAGEETVDVFDGYSFKGRHSVILDNDEEESSEEEADEEEEEEAMALNNIGLEEAPTPTPADHSEDLELDEPKTPEARVTTLPLDDTDTLPPLPDSPVPSTHTELPPDTPTEVEVHQPERAKPRKSKDIDEESKPAVVINGKDTITKAPNRLVKPARREKSGVQALDKYLSDAGEDGALDDEDDDWDFVEAVDGEDRNGNKGASLFARGVVDRYKLAVFRKGPTPTSTPRSVSGSSEHALAEGQQTPSPSVRRGSNQGLSTFRRNPRQFLKPKSPPSSYSNKASVKTQSMSSNAGISSVTSSGSLSMPSPSLSASLPGSPSLRSKESATSMGLSQSLSDQSDSVNVSTSDIPKRSEVEPGDKKSKKLKKYKENAEKVFQLFSPTPRLPSASSSHHP